jgi:pyruvate kinase
MNSHEFRVIVTVGPSLLANDEALRAIHSLGPCIYRINGAHVDGGSAAATIARVRGALGPCTIMLDLPGNKVRMANLSVPINVTEGSRYRLGSEQLNFPSVCALVDVGDRILADSANLVLEVVAASPDGLEVIARSDGTLAPNRGVHLEGAARRLPFLTDRDRTLIDCGVDAGVDYLSLSYVRTGADIRQVRALVPDGPALIAKIETAAALADLPGILAELDTFNVDRGDLASEVGITGLGRALERIVSEVRDAGKQLFLATQFLGAMERSPTPLIPEILDLERTLRLGINGIQLSEETAIGKYALECVRLIFDTHQRLEGRDEPQVTPLLHPREHARGAGGAG